MERTSSPLILFGTLRSATGWAQRIHARVAQEGKVQSAATGSRMNLEIEGSSVQPDLHEVQPQPYLDVGKIRFINCQPSGPLHQRKCASLKRFRARSTTVKEVTTTRFRISGIPAMVIAAQVISSHFDGVKQFFSARPWPCAFARKESPPAKPASKTCIGRRDGAVSVLALADGSINRCQIAVQPFAVQIAFKSENPQRWGCPDAPIISRISGLLAQATMLNLVRMALTALRKRPGSDQEKKQNDHGAAHKMRLWHGWKILLA